MAKRIAHDWEDVQQGIEGLSNYGKRKCKNCSVIQIKEAQHSWMKITGYRWEPLAGRCKGKNNDDS